MSGSLISFLEQGSDPGAAASGYLRLYAKTDGNLYTEDSSSNVTPVGAASSGGTSGEVWTSNGASVPTWQSAAGGSLTATYIGYGSVGNALTGTADFTWDDSTNTFTLGAVGGGGSAVTIAASDGTVSANNGTELILQGGGCTTGGNGGNTRISGGPGTSGGSYGGNLILSCSQASSVNGYVAIETAGSANILTFLNTGDYQVGPSLSSGTYGQVISSFGPGTSPLWNSVIQKQMITTTGTDTITDATALEIFVVLLGAQATETLTFPAGADGQVLSITAAAAQTTMTMVPAFGDTINTPLVTMTAGQNVRFIYDFATTTWY
jgi:hypothetical protein